MMTTVMALPALRADANLWSDIRESVADYCDERTPRGGWQMSRDLFSSDVLAFNFFFPLRQDTEAMTRALSALRGRPTRVDSLDLLPPTTTGTSCSPELRPVSNVVISYRDDTGSGLLLLKCTFTERDLGACPSRTGCRPNGGLGQCAAGGACSVAGCCPYLAQLEGSLEKPVENDGDPTCPFEPGGHQVMRGLMLARTLGAASGADSVDFGLVYDSRNTPLTSLVHRWRSGMRLTSWSYQEILAALGPENARCLRAWRAFLGERYGLAPADRCRLHLAAGARTGHHGQELCEENRQESATSIGLLP